MFYNNKYKVEIKTETVGMKTECGGGGVGGNKQQSILQCFSEFRLNDCSALESDRLHEPDPLISHDTHVSTVRAQIRNQLPETLFIIQQTGSSGSDPTAL